MNLVNLFKKRVPHGTITNFKSEDEYYEELFTKNSIWNKPNPNHEEILRWRIIEKFLFYVKGFYLNQNRSNLNILDLGCGRGWLSNLLSVHGTVKGIEPVKPVVSYANKLFPQLDISHGTSKDLLSLNFRQSFDIIVASEVIEHVPDPEKFGFVSDLYSLLKENGFAIITTPRKEAQEQWTKFCNPDQPIEDWMSEDEVADVFGSLGFSNRLLERFSISPNTKSQEIEVYQLWLFQK